MDASLLVSSINGAVELGKLWLNERDRHKAAAIQSDLTDKLLQAQAQVSQVLSAIIEKDGLVQTLAERVRELEAQQSERARYQLAKLGTVGDVFAYQLRPAAELVERSDEPSHFLCQPCFDGGKKSVLRIQGTIAYCSLCNVSIHIKPIKPTPKRQVIDTGFRRRDW